MTQEKKIELISKAGFLNMDNGLVSPYVFEDSDLSEELFKLIDLVIEQINLKEVA